MDLSAFTASGSAVIAAPPEPLYDFIADMPAIGEISPQCTGGQWESEERNAGAFFIGSNTVGDRTWQARMRVIVADRPREFAWENVGGLTSTEALARWGYTFRLVDGGTQVEETWRIVQSYPVLEALDATVRDSIPARMQASIDETLANMKSRFE